MQTRRSAQRVPARLTRSERKEQTRRALLDALNGVNRDHGFPSMEALDPSKRGAADVSFVAPYVDALAGLGAFGSGTHSPAETVEIDTLPEQIARAAVLIYRLTR